MRALATLLITTAFLSGCSSFTFCNHASDKNDCEDVGAAYGGDDGGDGITCQTDPGLGDLCCVDRSVQLPQFYQLTDSNPCCDTPTPMSSEFVIGVDDYLNLYTRSSSHPDNAKYPLVISWTDAKQWFEYAVVEWEGVTGTDGSPIDLQLNIDPTTNTKASDVGYSKEDGVNLIYMEEGYSKDLDGALAVARSFPQYYSGSASKCHHSETDIIFYTYAGPVDVDQLSDPSYDPPEDPIEWVTATSATGNKVSLPYVAVHEFGHAIGLDHPDPGCVNGTVMEPQAPPVSFQNIDIKDRDAALYLYGTIGGSKSTAASTTVAVAGESTSSIRVRVSAPSLSP